MPKDKIHAFRFSYWREKNGFYFFLLKNIAAINSIKIINGGVNAEVKTIETKRKKNISVAHSYCLDMLVFCLNLISFHFISLLMLLWFSNWSNAIPYLFIYHLNRVLPILFHFERYFFYALGKYTNSSIWSSSQ